MATPNPGDVIIESLAISNFDQSESWDLTRMCVEFNIYEDISSPFLRGDILIEDALSLITRLPIVGDESISISFKTPSFDGKSEYKSIKLGMSVIACEKLEVTSKLRYTLYKLSFISKERIADLTTIVDDALGPCPISEMVQQVAKNYLKLEGDKIQIETTSGNHQFVIPTMTPFETMVFLAGEAKSATSKVSNFFFFQTHEKHHFTTIDELIKNNKIEEVYYTTPQNVPANSKGTPLDSSDTQSTVEMRNPIDFRTMLSVTFENNFNVEQNIKSGMYDNTVLTIDPILKQFKPVEVKNPVPSENDTKSTKFNYYNNFYDFQPIYKGRNSTEQDALKISLPNRLISKESPWKDLTGSSHIRYLVTNDQQMKTNPKFEVFDRMRPSILPWIISFGGQFRSVVCDLIVPGDSERKPGDLIYFDLNEFGATDDVKNKLNEYISGAYFVTAVRHKYTREAAMRYVTIIQCVKNCYEKEIANAPGKAEDKTGEMNV